jgi:intracellular sulfur oxidation DsrE/DsrF family protein
MLKEKLTRGGLIILALLSIASPAMAADTKSQAPYGTATFSSYKDVDQIKQLKAVFDFYFLDPQQTAIVFNNINALLKATHEFGPKEIDPVSVVVVSHGPELVVWDKRNYAKYKDIVDRAASLAQQGVRFEVCRNAAAALGLKPEDLHGFVTVVPAGPYALTYWQQKGYALIPGGSTTPSKPLTSANKDDVHTSGGK